MQNQFLINRKSSCPLFQEIVKSYQKLYSVYHELPKVTRRKKSLEGTGGLITPSDLIAYQIGWGKLLLYWYRSGVNGTLPEMPGEGFSKWDYKGLARHFYTKYKFDTDEELWEEFNQTVNHILDVVEIEEANNQLEILGVWEWCTLKSGKKWPLSKWIRVNTVSPYKKAAVLIKSILKVN